jgi:voltage-gated potassium channel Kch
VVLAQSEYRHELEIDIEPFKGLLLGLFFIAGFGRVGSTIGRFLQANGVQATYLDIDPDNVDLLRKMGLRVFYGDASRHDLLRAAGAGEAALLIIAVDNSEKTLEIVETAKKHFPGLKLMVRTNSWNDSYEILDTGVKDIYRETLDSALRMAADALCVLGHRRFQAYRSIKTFRKHDEKYLRELAEMRHDRKELIRGARQRIEDLEKLLRSEIENIGWDAATLIEEFGKVQAESKESK